MPDTIQSIWWRTMKSAPKDGSWLLLCCDFGEGRRELTVARWVDNPSPGGPFGRFTWREMQDGCIAEKVPTHWMPLPTLPRRIRR